MSNFKNLALLDRKIRRIPGLIISDLDVRRRKIINHEIIIINVYDVYTIIQKKHKYLLVNCEG